LLSSVVAGSSSLLLALLSSCGSVGTSRCSPPECSILIRSSFSI
jgi:hypothetical protein